jgi:RNA polymerase sigma-70 factor (ECF subfamily)
VASDSAGARDDLTSVHLRSAVGGSADAVSWIVARFSPLLRANAEFRLGPTLRRLYDPEDIAAEVWCVALPRLGKLPERDGRLTPVLLRFLTTALRHVIGNLLQKHAGKARATVSLEPGSESGVATPEPVDTEVSGVVTRASRAERRDLVLCALDELSEDDRAIIVLRGIEQADLTDAAAQLGITPNAASVRYHRALARLRERLPGSVFEDLRNE